MFAKKHISKLRDNLRGIRLLGYDYLLIRFNRWKLSKRTRRKLSIIFKISSSIFFIGIIISGILLGYEAKFTGFGDILLPDGRYERGKTLWEWSELCLVPLILIIGGYYLNKTTKKAEQEKVAIQNSQNSFQKYLDEMTKLIIQQDLTIKQKPNPINAVAKARTITLLHQLVPKQKGELLRFLYESGLINREKTLIKLEGADFSYTATDYIILLKGANLSRTLFQSAFLRSAAFDEIKLTGAILDHADLTNVRFYKADLNYASFIRANLYRANMENSVLIKATLKKAFLRMAILKGATLRRANLTNANLIKADLPDANLENANLEFADLRGADLTGADMKNSNLYGARMKGAILLNADLKGSNITAKQLKSVISREGIKT